MYVLICLKTYTYFYARTIWMVRKWFYVDTCRMLLMSIAGRKLKKERQRLLTWPRFWHMDNKSRQFDDCVGTIKMRTLNVFTAVHFQCCMLIH